MKTQWMTCLLAPALALAVQAAPETFDFKDPKSVNNITFKLDAPLEKINGTASDISGTVTFDPENPGATTGKIVVKSASLTVPNALQTTHMRGNEWLDTAKFPEIIFEAKELKNVKTTADKITADVSGNFTLRGITNAMTIPVELSYLKDKLGARLGNDQKGDLLVIRAKFSIKRSDFKMNSGQMEDKVSNIINLELGIAGASPK